MTLCDSRSAQSSLDMLLDVCAVLWYADVVGVPEGSRRKIRSLSQKIQTDGEGEAALREIGIRQTAPSA